VTGIFFEACFVSGELILKPSAEIHGHVLDGPSVTAGEAPFMAIGITGHVFTTPAALRSFLASLA